MKLYIISQDTNRGYDTYDSAVVRAPDEMTARSISPITGKEMSEKEWENDYSTWASSADLVSAEYLGEAEEGSETGLVLASFNAS